jgi:hypothetical protein
VRSWQEVGFTIDALVMGHEVTFIRTGLASDPAPDRTETDQSSNPHRCPTDELSESNLPDVVLVTCVKNKLRLPAPAKDLYTSPLFTRERRYAENLGRPWFILSAEHGLVAPDEWLAPYERYLPGTSSGYRAAWGRWVAERLDILAGPLSGMRIEIHAGAAYVDAVAGELEAKGAQVVAPLEGLMMGQRLSWYDRQTGQGAAQPLTVHTPPTCSDSASRFVSILLERSKAVTPTEFLAVRRTDLINPGLYSWWVDESGAADLSDGVAIPVGPGLIYAGLAGATRWPSGRRSTNTLWSRIGEMHLGGNHKFSTFRLTLGSILAAAEGHDSIDESGLSTWMERHLVVQAAPVEDADTLGRLESEVLQTLDPPLNLQGMTSTPLRTRISELRRAYGGGR